MSTHAQDASAEIDTLIGGIPKTNSLIIAEKFGKTHYRVLRAIENLDCSPEFNAANFGAVEYIDAKGEKRPAYEITRDGFVFLAMGFTGREAAKWKEAYIDAFNRMEVELRRQPPSQSLNIQSRLTRLLIRFEENGRYEATPVPDDAYVLTPQAFPGAIHDLPLKDVMAVLQAVTHRLSAAQAKLTKMERNE